ncbi:hypothetical protein C3V43_10740 [Bacteroides heparinolyticus]|nr:hypothetical protein C3V43_10740 [Bacteroides heparinolyticus]
MLEAKLKALQNTPPFEMNKDYFSDEYYAHNYYKEQNVPFLYLDMINIGVTSTFSHNKGIRSYLTYTTINQKPLPLLFPLDQQLIPIKHIAQHLTRQCQHKLQQSDQLLLLQVQHPPRFEFLLPLHFSLPQMRITTYQQSKKKLKISF